MVEEKMHCCVSGIVESGHGFDLFGKVIYCHDNVLVSITGRRTESHEAYASFVEGTSSDDWM